jgi:hypothetical protein
MAGLKVTAIKIDPYMNIDAGTMRPQEHGTIKKGYLPYNPDVYLLQARCMSLMTVAR